MRWPWSARLAGARRPLDALLRARWIDALVAPRSIDDYLPLFDPLWSVHRVRARLQDVRRETTEAVSLWLLPNESWRGFRAGQFVLLSVRIDGVRHSRCFSLSSAPEDQPALRVTLKAHPGGLVSGWARERARPGDLVELSQAMGRFVLPAPVPTSLLFISGGSGITPILSLIRHLVLAGYDGDIRCLHYARDEVLFRHELEALARMSGSIRFQPLLTRRSPSSRFSPAQLEDFAPAWAESETFLCGPAPLEEEVTELWRAQGVTHRLHVERFGRARATNRARSMEPGARRRIVFERSGRQIEGDSSTSLLEQAELAGLRPPHGCRVGICRGCQCRKITGVVRNELTGEEAGALDEAIRLCISTPVTDVTLDL